MKMFYSKYNRFRKESYQTQTLIYERPNSFNINRRDKIVEKRALSHAAEKHIDKIHQTFQFLKQSLDQQQGQGLMLPRLISFDKTSDKSSISFEYIEGTSFNSLLFNAFSNKDKKLFLSLLHKYYSILSTGFEKITTSCPKGVRENFWEKDSFLFENVNLDNFYKLGMPILKGTFLDPVFDNIIVVKNDQQNDQYYLIDYEWFFEAYLPLDFIFVRAIHSCFFKKYNIYNIDKFISIEEVLQHFNIDGLFYNECIKVENNFQKSVVINEENNYLKNYLLPTTYTLSDLLTYKDHYQDTRVLKYYFHSKLWKITRKILNKFFASKFFNNNKKMLVVILTKVIFYYSEFKLRLNIFKTIYNRLNYQKFRPNFISKIYDGNSSLEDSKTSSVCLYAHFDPNAQIDDYVVRHLKALQKLDFAIIFSTTMSTSAADSEIDKIRPYCAHIILRKNIGIDFGSWKSALHLLETRYGQYLKNKCQYILLANDSVYGPLFDMSSMISEMRAKLESKEVDLFGLTDSSERKYHLQSYFLLFSDRVIKSKCWSKFWNNIKFYQDKQLIINKSEVGLSRAMLKGGFKLRAYFPYKKIAEQILRLPHHRFKLIIDFIPPNPSVWFWDVLIKYFDFPFLKRELFLNPPITIRTVKDLHDNSWKDVLRSKTYYSPEVITKHIEHIECHATNGTKRKTH
ncbi:MAG: hypothetical protein HQK49_08225 [Oligoflexia bacterium]|nr:hypothetical protein [Oligoflexia bacterium]